MERPSAGGCRRSPPYPLVEAIRTHLQETGANWTTAPNAVAAITS